MWYLSLVFISGWQCLIEWIWEYSFLCSFLEEFQKDKYKFFSKYLIEFAFEAIWSWTFLCWEFLNYSFHFSTCNWPVHIFHFFMVQFWKVVKGGLKCVFKKRRKKDLPTCEWKIRSYWLSKNLQCLKECNFGRTLYISKLSTHSKSKIEGLFRM